MLDQLQGYRTKIAAVVIGFLAANEVWHFVPDSYVQAILFLAGGSGLYFLREALDDLKNKVPPPEPPANPAVQRPSSPSGPGPS